jgi:two-component system chemotaxis sensor kinase CheA
MSHELRTPLNSMLVLSGLLSDNDAGNLTAKQVEYLKTIHAAGTDLLSLINQVLDLAKIEAGKQDVAHGVVGLEELCAYARRIFEPLARDKELAFSVELDADLPAEIRSDRRRIEQILNNLLGNAIKFTERGQVSLRLSRPGPDVALARGLGRDATLAISIEDTGAGIPLEHQGRIFAAFEQLDGSADRRYGGSGLGLSIARELSLLLGGEIQLRSTPGQGSTFTCYLPFTLPEHAESPRPVHASARLAPGVPAEAPHRESVESTEAMLSTRPANLFLGATILVAEDDMRTLYALSALLHAKGAVVLTADSGQNALDELDRQPQTQAVLLDMTMPERGGYEALRMIRAQARFALLPIVGLIARAQAAGGEDCVKQGASAQVTKPVDPEELCRVLHELLAERPHASLANSA